VVFEANTTLVLLAKTQHHYSVASIMMHCCTLPDQRPRQGTVVECRSSAGKLSLSCAWPAADRWSFMWVNRPLQDSQLGQLSLSLVQDREIVATKH